MICRQSMRTDWSHTSRQVVFTISWVLATLRLGIPAVADDPLFRRHDLNTESTYSACAAIDVNRDGRLDAVCGGWWYEAPRWTKHFLREVELIRGRYDDYSNLPLDVDGDGWLDLISANYRSQKMYWIRHPGKKLGPWSAHLIAQPGPMETARLVDVDGDGLLDVLPNMIQPASATTRNCSGCESWRIPAEGSRGRVCITRFTERSPQTQAAGPQEVRGRSRFWTLRGR